MLAIVKTGKVCVNPTAKSVRSIVFDDEAFVLGAGKASNDDLDCSGVTLLWGVRETSNLRHTAGDVRPRVV